MNSFSAVFNYLHSQSESNEESDLSYLIPLTFGVGSIATCAILALRCGVFGQKTQVLPSAHQSKIENRSNMQTSVPKKKSNKQGINTLPNGLSSKPNAVQIKKIAPVITVPEPVLKEQKPVVKPEIVNNNTDIPSDTKTAKKKKRKTKSKINPDAEATSTFPTHQDSSWITISTKKIKSQSPNHPEIVSVTTTSEEDIPGNKIARDPSPVIIENGNSPQVVDPMLPEKQPSKPLVTEPVRLVPTEVSGPRMVERQKLSSPLPPPAPLSAEQSKPSFSQPPQQQPAAATSMFSSCTSDQLVPILMSQVQAKDMECQILREEVVNLRKKLQAPPEVHHATSPLPVPLPAVQRVDASTDPCEALSSHTEPTKSTQNSSTPPLLPPNSNDVVLTTLQSEIARQAKEMVLAVQRNENLEKRLSVAKERSDTAKHESTKLAKAHRKELLELEKRLEMADNANRDLTINLTEALQSSELQRRKLEESDRTANRLKEDVIRLQQDLDVAVVLVKKNQVATSAEDVHKVLELEQHADLMLTHEALAQEHSVTMTELVAAQSERNNLLTKLEEVAAAQAVKEAELRGQVCTTEQRLQSAQLQLQDQLTERDQQINELRQNLVKKEQEISEFKELQQQQQQQLDAAATTTDESSEAATERIVELETKMGQYKKALSETEDILSKLQSSVVDEEAKWHSIVESANQHRQVMETKVASLTQSLDKLTAERDGLVKTVDKLREAAASEPLTPVDAAVVSVKHVPGTKDDNEPIAYPREASSDQDDLVVLANGDCPLSEDVVVHQTNGH